MVEIKHFKIFALSRGDVAMTGPVMWIAGMLRKIDWGFYGMLQIRILIQIVFDLKILQNI
jgi:hypothetical protein